MNFRCPKCKSSLFHVEETSSGYDIKCYKTKAYGWKTSTIKSVD